MTTYFWFGDPKVKLVLQSAAFGMLAGFLLTLGACSPGEAPPPGSAQCQRLH